MMSDFSGRISNTLQYSKCMQLNLISITPLVNMQLHTADMWCIRGYLPTYIHMHFLKLMNILFKLAKLLLVTECVRPSND